MSPIVAIPMQLMSMKEEKSNFQVDPEEALSGRFEERARFQLILFPARVKMSLTQKEADIQMMLAAGVHLGTKNVNFQVCD